MFKKALIWFGILLLIVTFYDIFYGEMSKGNSTEVPLSTFIQNVKEKNVSEVSIKGNSIFGRFTNGEKFSTYFEVYPNLVDLLSENNIKFDVAPEHTSMEETITALISTVLYLGLFFGLWYFLMKKMDGGGSKAMGFGKSKAKLLNEIKGKITFDDVAGIDEAKEEVTEVVDFLKDPTKFQKLGGRIPRGCLLVGPPGTGKTLLARAVAGEADVPFYSISGSDFVEMFVGVGASRVRDMFEQGKKNAPCIIFIDEIDAVGRHRGAGIGGGNDEREQTLNQLLVEMDGFEDNASTIIIAATNRPDVLDPALLRPGRFDRRVAIPNPDIAGREQIINVHIKKIIIAPDIDIKTIARATSGFSGADLANLVNEAALFAARKDKKVVTMEDMEEARDKVIMGVERKSVMKEEEKELTAYHEAGHALAIIYSKSVDPIHKATIVPRGFALGMVSHPPAEDRNSVTREELKAKLIISMGGRAAEEIIFGYDKVTSGASGDIENVTGLADAMVREWGMSDELGTIKYDDKSYEHSNETALLIEREIKRLVDEGHDKAKEILNEHIDELHVLAKALLKYETLTGDEIKAIINGEDIKQEAEPNMVKRKSSVPESKKKEEKQEDDKEKE